MVAYKSAMLAGMWQRLFRRRPPLGPQELARWERDGFLILRDFMPGAAIRALRDAVEREWAHAEGNDHEIDLLTGPDAGRAFRLGEAPTGARNEAYKLNNLFARRADVRAVALEPRLRDACAQLLDGEPLICNSLNFERGSQQPFHIDTWYMPPPVDDKMVVASICVDDVDASNGPVVYYPGSHRIPPYRFSDGRLNEIPGEMPKCRAYLDAEIAARGLAEEEFRGRSGDVLIWHAQLLHGGRPILDRARTRASLVVHYWRACDLPADQVRTDPKTGSYLGRTLRGEIRF